LLSNIVQDPLSRLIWKGPRAGSVGWWFKFPLYSSSF
jgi:hypothetical protein